MSAKTLTKESKEGKFDKYLTEMKELPPTVAEEQKQTTVTEEVKVQAVGEEEKEGEKHSSGKDSDLGEMPRAKEPLPKPVNDKFVADDVNEESGRRKLPFTSKDAILGVVNLISIILLVIILLRFPGRSKELKDLRIQNVIKNSNINLEYGDVEANKPRASLIEEFFLDESGVVNFIGDVENQEVEGGATIKVTFASQSAVKDRTGNFGVPVVIELTGSWESIDVSLQKIDSLRYLFRPASVEISYSDQDPLVVIFKYGVFLYVRESLGQTR